MTARRLSQAQTPERIRAINERLQQELRKRGLPEVAAVEAAAWLDAAGLLPDAAGRPGLPLRELLRADLIDGSQQRPADKYGRWYIVRV